MDFSSDISADSDPATQPNGVDPNEAIRLALTGDYSNVLDNLISGDLRIGIHVQGFANGGSEGFVNTPPTVPAPSAVILGSIGIAFVGFLRNRKSHLIN